MLTAARRTLSSTKELGAVVMSFFTCGKKAKEEDSAHSSVLKALAEEVRWKFLIDGTFAEMLYHKVSIKGKQKIILVSGVCLFCHYKKL
jgi:hypothetical protein